MTQNEMVLAYIKEHGSIDPLRAFADLGILRLGARIFDLKELGVPIRSEMKVRYDQDGKAVKRWKEYSLA